MSIYIIYDLAKATNTASLFSSDAIILSTTFSWKQQVQNSCFNSYVTILGDKSRENKSCKVHVTSSQTTSISSSLFSSDVINSINNDFAKFHNLLCCHTSYQIRSPVMSRKLQHKKLYELKSSSSFNNDLAKTTCTTFVVVVVVFTWCHQILNLTNNEPSGSKSRKHHVQKSRDLIKF